MVLHPVSCSLEWEPLSMAREGKGEDVCVCVCVGHQNEARVVTHRTCLGSSTRANTRSCVYSKANTGSSVSCLYLCSGHTKRMVCILVAQGQIEFMTQLDPGSLSDNKPCLFVPFFLSSSQFTSTVNAVVSAVRKIQIR